jgi:predicted DNA-binding ribbon-helix-helix protein
MATHRYHPVAPSPGFFLSEAPRRQYSIAGSFVVGEAVSPVFRRSVVIAGHKTSVSIEDEFWNCLKEIASERGMSLAAMIGAIDGGRKHANLSSAIRLFVLGVYRDQLGSWGGHEREEVQS